MKCLVINPVIIKGSSCHRVGSQNAGADWKTLLDVSIRANEVMLFIVSQPQACKRQFSAFPGKGVAYVPWNTGYCTGTAPLELWGMMWLTQNFNFLILLVTI